MEIQTTRLPGVCVIEPRVFRDSRGFFMETFHERRYSVAGASCHFVQDNFSRSCRGTIRGLHYQINQPQAKLVQVVRGELFDVAVDLRRHSPTFGQWVGIHLREEHPRQVLIPVGFAHGFCVLSEVADFFYKCSDFYAPEHERTLLWNDPAIGIEWPITDDPILSEKDQHGVPLSDVECFE